MALCLQCSCHDPCCQLYTPLDSKYLSKDAFNETNLGPAQASCNQNQRSGPTRLQGKILLQRLLRICRRLFTAKGFCYLQDSTSRHVTQRESSDSATFWANLQYSIIQMLGQSSIAFVPRIIHCHSVCKGNVYAMPDGACTTCQHWIDRLDTGIEGNVLVPRNPSVRVKALGNILPTEIPIPTRSPNHLVERLDQGWPTIRKGVFASCHKVFFKFRIAPESLFVFGLVVAPGTIQIYTQKRYSTLAHGDVIHQREQESIWNTGQELWQLDHNHQLLYAAFLFFIRLIARVNLCNVQRDSSSCSGCVGGLAPLSLLGPSHVEAAEYFSQSQGFATMFVVLTTSMLPVPLLIIFLKFRSAASPGHPNHSQWFVVGKGWSKGPEILNLH